MSEKPKLTSRDLKRALRNFFLDETGQSTTEYILILAIVVMIALKFKNIIGDKIEGVTRKVATDIDDATNF